MSTSTLPATLKFVWKIDRILTFWIDICASSWIHQLTCWIIQKKKTTFIDHFLKLFHLRKLEKRRRKRRVMRNGFSGFIKIRLIIRRWAAEIIISLCTEELQWCQSLLSWILLLRMAISALKSLGDLILRALLLEARWLLPTPQILLQVWRIWKANSLQQSQS